MNAECRVPNAECLSIPAFWRPRPDRAAAQVRADWRARETEPAAVRRRVVESMQEAGELALARAEAAWWRRAAWAGVIVGAVVALMGGGR